MKKYFAITKWMIEDIREIKPEWTEEKCRIWWEEHEKAFTDILTEYGNECLEIMLDQ